MSEKDLLNDLQQIDDLLAQCVNPALNRNNHEAIKQTMLVVVQRIKLSYRLEAEKKDNEDAKKEPE